MRAPRVIFVAGRLIPAFVIMLAAAGCSNPQAPFSPRDSSGFGLVLSPEPSVAALQPKRLDMTVAVLGSETEVRVSVEHAEGLKAALFTVAYDPARYTPLRVETDSVLRAAAGGSELICLSILNRPGRVYCGQVLANYEKHAGFSGSGPVAVVRFASRPFAATSRVASTPPDSPLSSITDLNFSSATGELSWHFYNHGDYDQNGEVGLSDLGPIARFFSQGVVAADRNLAKGVADGDANGEVNLADISPIGANFARSINGGWRIYGSANVADYPSDPHDNNGGASVQANLLLTDNDPSTNATNHRLLYRTTLLSPTPGDTYWVRGVDTAGAEGIASNIATTGTTDNPPVAQFNTHAGNGLGLTGTAPHTIEFNAAPSYDPDSQPITYYSWDFDDDGTEDNMTSLVFHTYPVPGVYSARLTVTANGLTGTIAQTITVNDPGTWHIQTLDATDDSGQFCSLAVVSGAPAIAYRRASGV